MSIIPSYRHLYRSREEPCEIADLDSGLRMLWPTSRGTRARVAATLCITQSFFAEIATDARAGIRSRIVTESRAPAAADETRITQFCTLNNVQLK